MDVNSLAPLINPKEVVIKGRKGREATFILSEIPATYSREIVAKWTANALPKMGEYSINEAMMLKMMTYVAIPQKSGPPLRITSRELLDNHTDFLMLANLEKEMAMYNWDFFLEEEFSNLKNRIIRIFSIWLTQILTRSFQQSLRPEKQHSTS